MAFTLAGDRVWTLPPDWSGGVSESLGWLSDVQRASANAVSVHRGLRAYPRRGFSFNVFTEGADRQAADMLLAGHSGTWMLPIWPDVQWLQATLSAGATEIPCATAGFDFVEGGKALLHRSLNDFEVVEIDGIASDHLAFSGATSSAFGVGCRLYPLRKAQVRGSSGERLFSSAVGRRQMQFAIDEPCAWPALAAPATYLEHLVLDVRPDESVDPSNGVQRLTQQVDYGTSTPWVNDLSQFGMRGQESHWRLYGREQHSWFRSLLYTLDGRRVPIWIPSWTESLAPVAAVAGGGTSLEVRWCGYTLFGLGKANRRDLRIELTDGSVFYRRATAAVEAGATEILTLDASLDVASILPERIREVSLMAMCTLDSDTVEIQHDTDAEGLARCDLGWEAVVPDV